MNFIGKLNKFYSRYLFIVVPVAIIIISCVELFFGNNTAIRRFAYIFITLLSVVFFIRYVLEGRKNEGFCLIQLTYLFIVSVMACGKLFKVSDLTWIILSVILFFIIFFVLFYIIGSKKRLIS